MKELKILDLESKETGKMKLPEQFQEDIRPDLLKRAFLAIMSHLRQAYGTSPEAGKRQSVEISKRRHDYRGSYGHGISRVPRKIMSRRGTRMNWQGAFAPGTVGGRQAHPPKSERIWWQKINKKERKLAIRSAISATLKTELVEKRGHKLSPNYPFIIDSSIESLDKTSKVKETLIKLGLEKELERCEKKKIRSGAGTKRGRKYIKRKGPLLVVSKDCNLTKSAANIPGIDVCEVKNLNVRLLAPGAVPGRLTLWSKDAVELLSKEKLFN
ncbi:MAG: 50S ribosomal protein L4 [Nanoarchaeota archaeon]|nr:50S ribosomal protein L4 [Nanoarchaeota archaeon]MBU1004856.1 50S ribosomal protein L4 [Nanoarchaeota archaeon]MBU1946332.1 50S ribosomal protein L4 [Nanoarchaeota archaeon]